MLGSGIVAAIPSNGDHRLFWNNYPATALDHDLSNAVETALLFISIDSFLSDPKGLTNNTLHFFNRIFEVFTSDTMTGWPIPAIQDSENPFDECEPVGAGAQGKSQSAIMETAGDLSEHHRNRSIALTNRRSMSQSKRPGQG